MVSVGLSVTCKKLTMRHYDFSRTHLQGTAQRRTHIRVLAEGQQKFGENMVGRLAERMYATEDASHTCQLDSMSPILRRARWLSKRQAPCGIVLQCSPSMRDWPCLDTTLRAWQTIVVSDTHFRVHSGKYGHAWFGRRRLSKASSSEQSFQRGRRQARSVLARFCVMFHSL